MVKARRIEKVLVTGGLGFIGSHVVDLLVEKGYHVKILDNLEPQVHGNNGELPRYRNKDAVLLRGDAREHADLIEALDDVDAVIHLAAAVGVGQSMYEIEKYVASNTHATANLLDLVVNRKPIKKLIVASSMSIYGEGKYICKTCDVVAPNLRGEKRLSKQEWELLCPTCGKRIRPVPTSEDKPLMPTSIYAQTKRHQEEMCLLIGKTYGIPSVALRFFNVYGPRQSLRNPYTGVAAIFISRLLNGNPPYVFEDGNQTRDFVHVEDLAQGVLLALERNAANYEAVNIGTGKASSINMIANLLIDASGLTIRPHVPGRYRKGDIRHCYADIAKARRLLGYEPKVNLRNGLGLLYDWAKENKLGSVDSFDTALKELEHRKLA
jgi:dTDP-L-rhamnose 4-epimerase